MSPRPRPDAVVLSAGASRRKGRPKALLRLDRQSLISRHVAALGPFSSRILPIVGSRHRRVGSAASVPCARSPRWHAEWPADSLRRALLWGGFRGWCWVTPVDVAPLAPHVARRILSAGGGVPCDRDGREGHPVLLPPDIVRCVREAAPAGGLRTLLTELPRVEVDDVLVSLDFDDPQSYQRFVERWGRA